MTDTKRLRGKNIYIVVTGCNGTKRIKDLITPLAEDGANCFLIPTPAALEIMQENLSYYADCKICLNKDLGRHYKIPEEDLLIIAPCSFNTVNKITQGIADNYAMSLAQASVGAKKPVIIALSMNTFFWEHFAFKESLNKLSKQKNIVAIWPEFIYENNKLSRLTMAPFEKTIDTVYKTFGILRYDEMQAKKSHNFERLIDSNIDEFVKCGRFLAKNNFVQKTAGCIGKRVDEGILISTTGAKIGELERKNITLIKSHKNNSITWQGDLPPTSESLLVCCIFRSLLESHLIHTHNSQLTYDPALQYLQTSQYVETGKTTKSNEVLSLLRAHHGVAVLKLHGQIATSNSFNQAIKKLVDLKSKLTRGK